MNDQLRGDLIKHASKEIETLSNNITNSRLRAAVTYWVGPFALFGALLLRADDLPALAWDRWLVVPIALSVASYFALSRTAAWVEEYAGKKCNEWRSLIAGLGTGKELTEEDVNSLLADPYRLTGVWPFYLAVFGEMFISFVAVVWLVLWLVQ